MDDHERMLQLRQLMQNVGEAINQSLSESELIAAAIAEVKKAGYDVFLVLEATIGFNQRPPGTNEEEDESEDTERRQPQTEHPVTGKFGAHVDSRGNARIKLSGQDDQFLKELHISMESDQDNRHR